MFDPVGTLTAFFASVAAAFNSWYTSAVQATIAFLMSSSLPSQKDIHSDFFRLNFGGIIGLALYLVSAIALFVLLAFFLAPRKDHSLRASRFIGSLIGLVVYAILFFRIYAYVDNASKGMMQLALNFITHSKNGTVDQINNMLGVSTPSGIGSVVVLGVFSVIFCWFASATAFMIKIVVLVILILYPLLIVLRPLGSVAIAAFNAANSFLVVGILSPIIMVWAIALPLVARNLIPGADATGLTSLITLVCSAGALIAPFILLYIFFRLSSQVFGSVNVEGNTAITSMPPLSWDEVQQDMQDTRSSPFKDAFGDTARSAFSEGGGGVSSLLSAIPDTLVNAGVVAATAEFGPMAGAAIKTVHGKIKEQHAASVEAKAIQASPPVVTTQEGDPSE
jgi:hypothetical protein